MAEKSPASNVRRRLLDAGGKLMVHKGYTAVGLAEVVAAAGVPKGSFYYYFASKEDFAQALVDEYYSTYLTKTDEMLSEGQTAVDGLLAYFRRWTETQVSDATDARCLLVKLASEVCDLSDPIRLVLDKVAVAIVARLTAGVEKGRSDGSIRCDVPAHELAQALYEMWLGASLLAKLSRSDSSFTTAYATTRRLLLS